MDVLLRHSADLVARDVNGTTVLHFAILNPSCFSFLLKTNDLDVNSTDFFGRTILHYLAMVGFMLSGSPTPEILQELQRVGINEDMVDCDGFTASQYKFKAAWEYQSFIHDPAMWMINMRAQNRFWTENISETLEDSFFRHIISGDAIEFEMNGDLEQRKEMWFDRAEYDKDDVDLEAIHKRTARDTLSTED